MRPSFRLAAAAPRRRVRTPPPPLRAFPSVDLIGPPCPLSNLRPVYYAPLFPSLPPPAVPFNARSDGSPHPYSLAEFPSSSASSSSSSSSSSSLTPADRPSRARQAHLARVQHRLHAQDLEWRLSQYRLDGFNQSFWARTNADFLARRDAFVLAHPADADAEVDLSPFYRDHLERTKALYAEYNARLWRMQAAQLWPAAKAVWRPWKWRWELWKAGVVD